MITTKQVFLGFIHDRVSFFTEKAQFFLEKSDGQWTAYYQDDDVRYQELPTISHSLFSEVSRIVPLDLMCDEVFVSEHQHLVETIVERRYLQEGYAFNQEFIEYILSEYGDSAIIATLEVNKHYLVMDTFADFSEGGCTKSSDNSLVILSSDSPISHNYVCSPNGYCSGGHVVEMYQNQHSFFLPGD